MEHKSNASGWQIRCTKCDCAEPWSKPVARTKSGGRKFVFSRCPQCKRIRFRVIEPMPDPTLLAA